MSMRRVAAVVIGRTRHFSYPANSRGMGELWQRFADKFPANMQVII